MKKVLFGLIATVMFSISGNAQSEMKPEESGFYHTEGLKLLKESKSEWVKLETNQIMEFSAKKMADKYPKLFSNIDLKVLHENFDSHVYGKFNYEDCVNIWEKNKSKYLKNSITATKLIDKLIHEEPSVDEALLQFDEALKYKNLTENDINSLIVAKSVLKSSDEFWESNPTNYSKANPWRSKFADAFITVLFWEAGPVGYIAGMVASEFITASGQ